MNFLDLDKIENIIKYRFEPFGYSSHNYPMPIGLWEEEQRSLLWLALNAPPGDFLEIGSFAGGSTCLLCIASRYREKDEKIYAVDIDFTHANNAFDRMLRIGKFQDICIKVEGGSCALQFRGDVQIKKISFAFVDAWHSYKAALVDFYAINPSLIKGGIIAFHDCAPQPYKPEQLKYFYERSIASHDEWWTEPLIVDKPWKSKEEFHKLEQQQNFCIDEVVAKILNEYSYELVEFPAEYYQCNHMDVAGEYVRGKTSPYNALVALRKL